MSSGRLIFKGQWCFSLRDRKGPEFPLEHVLCGWILPPPPPFSRFLSACTDIWHQYSLAGASGTVLCWTAAMLKWPNSTHSLAAIKALCSAPAKKCGWYDTGTAAGSQRGKRRRAEKRAGGRTDVGNTGLSGPSHLLIQKRVPHLYGFPQSSDTIINTTSEPCFVSRNNKGLISSVKRPPDGNNQREISLQAHVEATPPLPPTVQADLAFNNLPFKNIHKMITTCVNTVPHSTQALALWGRGGGARW